MEKISWLKNESWEEKRNSKKTLKEHGSAALSSVNLDLDQSYSRHSIESTIRIKWYRSNENMFWQGKEQCTVGHCTYILTVCEFVCLHF